MVFISKLSFNVQAHLFIQKCCHITDGWAKRTNLNDQNWS